MKILNRHTKEIIFEDPSCKTIKDLIEEAGRRGIDIKGAKLEVVNLVRADFKGGDFRVANFVRADFEGAHLMWVGSKE